MYVNISYDIIFWYPKDILGKIQYFGWGCLSLELVVYWIIFGVHVLHIASWEYYIYKEDFIEFSVEFLLIWLISI